MSVVQTFGIIEGSLMGVGGFLGDSVGPWGGLNLQHTHICEVNGGSSNQLAQRTHDLAVDEPEPADSAWPNPADGLIDYSRRLDSANP